MRLAEPDTLSIKIWKDRDEHVSHIILRGEDCFWEKMCCSRCRGVRPLHVFSNIWRIWIWNRKSAKITIYLVVEQNNIILYQITTLLKISEVLVKEVQLIDNESGSSYPIYREPTKYIRNYKKYALVVVCWPLWKFKDHTYFQPT